jgi:glycosyltransferase involved in cell wall biosynthesis
VDGGSQDDSVDIIRKYEPWLSYWISERDRGQSHALNKGFARASGDVFGWINSDDFYLPGALEAVARAYAEGDGEGIYVGSGEVVDAVGKCIGRREAKAIGKAELMKWEENWFLQQACFWTRKCWEGVGGVDEKFELLMDYELWMRFEGKYPFRQIDRPLGALRYYPQAKSVAMASRGFAEMAVVKSMYGAADEAIAMIERCAIELSRVNAEIHALKANRLVRVLRRLWPGFRA